MVSCTNKIGAGTWPRSPAPRRTSPGQAAVGSHRQHGGEAGPCMLIAPGIAYPIGPCPRGAITVRAGLDRLPVQATFGVGAPGRRGPGCRDRAPGSAASPPGLAPADRRGPGGARWSLPDPRGAPLADVRHRSRPGRPARSGSSCASSCASTVLASLELTASGKLRPARSADTSIWATGTPCLGGPVQLFVSVWPAATISTASAAAAMSLA